MSGPLNGAPVPSPSILDQFGRVVPSTTDPAWQPPRDPLADGQGATQARARVINRAIPAVALVTSWTVTDVRLAIEDLVLGLFDKPAQLVDTMGGDARVQSALSSRSGGLLGRPIEHELPKGKESDADAKRCLDAWREMWRHIGVEESLGEFQRWSSMIGFQNAQLLWDTSEEVWCPYVRPWHARYTYWHWTAWCFVAISLDGQIPITPGDGHWISHAPFGAYQGWMRGALRAIAPWWLARSYGLRDWARYSERHGMPILKAGVPFGADTDAIDTFRTSLAQLGQESVIQLPQSDDPSIGKYDVTALEFSDQAWLAFLGLITQCNAEITLALLGQNLTTEVKEGSFAAARVHADVRQAILEADARALEHTIYTQIARPFAAINFGDPELAPRTRWDVAPYEDNKLAADTFQAFATAVAALREAGVQIKDLVALGRTFGLSLASGDLDVAPPMTKVAPTEEEAAKAAEEPVGNARSSGKNPSGSARARGRGGAK